jgi:TRAP-type mannitol/chloroaromatic compound transport system permease small subunit
MEVLRKIAKASDWFNEWVGLVFSWLIVPLVLLTVMEVIMRRFLGSPTIWSFETLNQIYGLHFMIVAAYGLKYGAHVSVDLFTHRMTPKRRAALDIFSYLIFFFPFCIVGIVQGYRFAATSWGMREHSWSVFSPPLYPIKTVIMITFILLLAQGIAEVIKKIFIIKGLSYD